jgi:hypothetical protein
VLIVQGAGWASRPIWMIAVYVTATGIRSSDRPTRSSVAIATNLSRPNAKYTASNDSDSSVGFASDKGRNYRL